MEKLFMPVQDDIAKTTHLCIAAHQDDIEIMAYNPIIECYGKDDKHFTGVVVTDGAGSPRSGVYEKYTDEQMKEIRVEEQNAAAIIGKYLGQYQLGYSSKKVKGQEACVIEEIKELIIALKPSIIYTHNLADKHDTHVAVAACTIKAIRSLPEDCRPEKVIALEVWRGLDWVCDTDKLALDTSKHPNVAAALLGVFDSQIAGGKRYDLAAVGRRLANATFYASHSVDSTDSLTYGLDITELAFNQNISLTDYIGTYIDNFKNEVFERIAKFM